MLVKIREDKSMKNKKKPLFNIDDFKDLPLKESVDKFIQEISNINLINIEGDETVLINLSGILKDEPRLKMYFIITAMIYEKNRLLQATKEITEILDAFNLKEYPLLYDNDDLFNITDKKYIDDMIREIKEMKLLNKTYLNHIKSVLDILINGRMQYNKCCEKFQIAYNKL